MTIQQIRQLAQKYELRDMLTYLHDLGEIVFCDKVGDEGIIVTDINWLLCIFRAIIQLHDCQSGSLERQGKYEQVRQTGRISIDYTDYVLNCKEIHLDIDTKKTEKYSLHESDEELRDMLTYSHDLGEILFCDKVGDGGIIVTDVDWLLRILRDIVHLHDCPFGTIMERQYKYE
ncbi:uncharacterized protein TRIADDRAFT_55360 [Trichoplax adhaerens]|uniref:Uncharacterized protein n=1 Tax=Trichoplax adhaerens TaxID=10228 RepID=B3RUP1_TRIAD|nr:predicted protein [Trichoplax adhaerens]EDV25856.1 predicted protein [Trichoplax adhaerens]|eukprot:XP_002111889.1 predicted protein [Trichoplax adhaerens]